MATREDFLTLAELLGVVLSLESFRHLRSLERTGEEEGERIVMGKRGDQTVWLLASKRAVISTGKAPHIVHSITNEFCAQERFYASFRPENIDSAFATWSKESQIGARVPWLLET